MPLVKGVDYLFSYSSDGNIVSLTSPNGSFADGAYQITLSSGLFIIRDRAGNIQPPTILTVSLDSSLANARADLRVLSATADGSITLLRFWAVMPIDLC